MQTFAPETGFDVAASGAGDAFDADLSDLVDKWVQVFGTSTDVLRIEGSFNGSNWATVSATITADGIYEIAANVKYLRVNHVSGSGTPTVLFRGRYASGVL